MRPLSRRWPFISRVGLGAPEAFGTQWVRVEVHCDEAPMSAETLKRLMATRSVAAYIEQRRNERRVAGARLGVALALVIANRVGNDWGWLDEDRAFHQT